ncbi:MAG: hypothetical protein HY905_18710 [Deltaproteobacteria bacterium]|nr:hypothetical protein [Deltaproteobacteria bacterium]
MSRAAFWIAAFVAGGAACTTPRTATLPGGPAAASSLPDADVAPAPPAEPDVAGPVLAALPEGPQLGAGAMHTCYLHPDGRVLCWGSNTFGNLGDGTDIDRYSPVAVRGLDDAVLLAVDATGACARRAGGDVLCWGTIGTASPGSLEPVPVAGLAGVVRLILLYDDICGLTPAGDVLCRARREDPGAGEATRDDGAADAVELVGGGRTACIRRAGGEVRCWGANDYGQLGDRTTNASASAVAVAGIDDAVALWSSGTTTWARRADGSVWVWGFDETRDVLDQASPPMGPRPVTEQADLFARVADVQLRCLRTVDGEVWCRSLTEDGTALSVERTRVEFPSPVRGLAVGGVHACGVDEAGQVRCFGQNRDGQLGLGGSADSVAGSTPVPGVDDATQIVAGEWDACALRRSGRVACWRIAWGDEEVSAPADVPGIADAVAVHSGGQYTCAVDRRGVTRCWGNATWLDCIWESDDNCQPERWASPRPVDGLAGIAGAVEVVGDCVLLPGGVVGCVARYDEGTPVWTVEGVDDAARLAGGAWLRCILRENRTVACLWPQAGRSWAVRADELAGVDDAVAVGASATQVCVVHETGAVSCTPPPAGPGDSCAAAAEPCARVVPVEGVAEAVDVAVGNGFACALLRGGSVSCWGRGEYGVLGNGTTDDAPAATPVAGLSGVKQLVAREDHACALGDDGRVLCWGRILPGLAALDAPGAAVPLPVSSRD